MTLRQQAMQICLLAASTDDFRANYERVSQDSDFSEAATELARQAWRCAMLHTHTPTPAKATAQVPNDRYWAPEADLLAYELLEAGWRPGDDIDDYLT